nr:hypothetical protein [Leclercia sp.]
MNPIRCCPAAIVGHYSFYKCPYGSLFFTDISSGKTGRAFI